MKMRTECAGKRNVRFEWLLARTTLLLLSTAGKGFVHVATQARVPIIPAFLANHEEMRWNPAQYLWNLFRLGRLFSYIVQLNIPVLTPLLVGIGMGAWFSTTWIQIPIPAKLTLYIGDPVSYDMSKDSIDDVTEAAEGIHRCSLIVNRLSNALDGLCNR